MTEPKYALCDQMPSTMNEDRAAVAAVKRLNDEVDILAESLHEMVNHRLQPVMQPADQSVGSVGPDEKKDPVQPSPLTVEVLRLIGRIRALDMTIRSANDRLEV